MDGKRYNEGGIYEIGCGFYKLRKIKNGLLKADPYSKDIECIKRRKTEHKRRIKSAKKEV